MTARIAIAIAIAGAACGARAHGGGAGARGGGAGGDTITLYRDLAVIQHRVAVDVPEAGSATARAVLGAGVELSEVEIIDRGELTVSAVRDADAAAAPVPADAGVPPDAPAFEDPLDVMQPSPREDGDGPGSAGPTHAPTAVTFDVTAPHAGHYTLTLAYTTHLLTWEAAYTMTTTPARTAVDARGAIAITNGTGIAYPGARVILVDDALGAQRDNLVERIVANESGRATTSDPDSHPARPHELGRIDVVDGEVRAELYAPGARRALRSVLVYDPIGTKLDNPAASPQRDEGLGVVPPASTRIVESAEIVRDTTRDLGLPGGPARLIERRPDGALVVLADGRMFDAPTRVAGFDTIPIGVARDVLGHRARRDFNIDEDRRRLSEDFTIDVDNRRAEPVQVVLVEHLYRGADWAIAFHSVPVGVDGPQEVSLRTVVPAHGKASVLYVVVYWWDELK